VAEQLLIRLSRAAHGDSHWRVVGASGPGAVQQGRLEEAAAAASGRRVVLLVPGSDVLLTRVPLPVRNRARAAVAVPWALEDRLVADVEDLHFALGSTDAEGRWAVAVVARARLDAWLEEARAAGLDPQAVVPDPLALPTPPADAWTALEESDCVTVRTGAADGFACEPDLLADVVAARAVPEAIARRLAADAVPVVWPAALAEASGVETLPQRLGDTLDAFDATAAGTTALNLLQGPYSRRERVGRALRRWRLPAALAAALVLVVTFQAGLRYAQLGRREARLRGEIEHVFRQSFPEVQRVVNATAQMRTRLDALRKGKQSGPGFSGTLAQAGAVIAATEGSRVQSLSWQNGVLEVKLDAGNLQDLDRIKRGLEDRGLNTRISGAERKGKRVSGRLRIGGGGGSG